MKLLFFIISLLAITTAIANPKYELRGVWIATVNNIDWPSKPGLPSDIQKKEIIALLNIAKKNNLNAVFLQVRPTSDAIFPSIIEPWSFYISGKSGQKPSPYYDPLKYWIEQAHKRNIELHAWINPFRASMSINDELDTRHPVKKHPEWFIKYANKHQYDPGNPKCREHIFKVVDELITRYNIDGIHMDDYFYPYPVKNEIFNDSSSFIKHNPNKINTIEDWRRQNVNMTIEGIRNTIKIKKPEVAFGISPFGVWRNNNRDSTGSTTQAGITNYDDLYADVLKWLKNGWIDYIIPQIYWDTEHSKANYKTLTKWWSNNSYGKPLFIGHALYRIKNDNENWNNPSQMPNQISFLRDSTTALGSVFFSINHFKRDILGFQDSLKNKFYKYPALIPSLTDKYAPPIINSSLNVKKRFGKIKLSINNPSTTIKHFVIYTYKANETNPLLYPKNIYSITKEKNIIIKKNLFEHNQTYYFKIEAIDHFNRSCGISMPIRKKF
ncbi:MAG: family 10 glycosylhydrolase [Marinilabiliaceae bacterium]|nr:family 10 glycosylhydrolase [Marinilabiliaceae bacterium]